jgi:hypothetical protein
MISSASSAPRLSRARDNIARLMIPASRGRGARSIVPVQEPRLGAAVVAAGCGSRRDHVGHEKVAAVVDVTALMVPAAAMIGIGISPPVQMRCIRRARLLPAPIRYFAVRERHA